MLIFLLIPSKTIGPTIIHIIPSTSLYILHFIFMPLTVCFTFLFYLFSQYPCVCVCIFFFNYANINNFLVVLALSSSYLFFFLSINLPFMSIAIPHACERRIFSLFSHCWVMSKSHSSTWHIFLKFIIYQQHLFVPSSSPLLSSQFHFY